MSDHLIAEANRHAMALADERNNLVVELKLLREWQREVIQNEKAHHAERESAIARAERAEAELAEQKYIKRSSINRAKELTEELTAERARLDWIEENAGDMHRYNSSKYIWFSHQNLRAAIDAAMKEGNK